MLKNNIEVLVVILERLLTKKEEKKYSISRLKISINFTY